MSLYEGMFLLDSRQANRDWDGLVESLKAILAKHGAQVERDVKWGERRLAYEINGRRRGTYVLWYFNAPGEAITPIYREVELSDSVHRALILKVSKVPSDEDMFIPTEGSGWRRGARPPTGKPVTASGDDAGKPVAASGGDGAGKQEVKEADKVAEVVAVEETVDADQPVEAKPEVEEAAKPEAPSDSEDPEEPKVDAAPSDV